MKIAIEDTTAGTDPLVRGVKPLIGYSLPNKTFDVMPQDIHIYKYLIMNIGHTS